MRLGWVREIRYNNSSYTSNFVGYPGSFTVNGLNPRRTLFSPGLALTTLFKEDTISLNLSYDAEVGSKFSDQMGSLQLNFSF